MKKLLFFLCFLYSFLGWGQIAFYNFQNTDSAVGVDSNISASNVSISSGSILYQAGTDDGGTTIGNSGTWNTSNFSTTGKYLQFTISPNSGYSINFSEIRLRFGRTANGPQQVTVQYSLDAFATAGITMLSNGAVTSEDANNLNSFSITTGLPTSVTGTLTVRIWGHNASSTGNLRFNNFRVFGTVLPSAIQSTQTGNWSDTSTWVGGVVPGDGDNVQINNGHTVTTGARTRNSGTTTIVAAGGTLAVTGTYTNNGTTTINGTFRLNGGGWSNGSDFVYGANGTLEFNTTYTANSGSYWPVTNGPFNVTVTSVGGLTLGFTRTVNGVFQLSNSLQSANNLTINGTFRLNGGGFVQSGNPTYGSNAILQYNSGGNYDRGNEWNANSAGAGYPNHVMISNNNTVVNLGSGVAHMAGNLTIESNTTLNTPSGQNLNVLGNVINNGTINLNGDVRTNGHWTLSASATQNNNNRAVFFIAPSDNQFIDRIGGGTVNFDYLIVNKDAGELRLSSNNNTDVQINATSGNVLQILNNGSLNLQGRSLTLNNNGGNILVDNSGTRIITSSLAGGQLIISGNKTVTGGSNLSIESNVATILTAGFDPGNNKTTINGTIRIRPNGFINNNPPIYANTSTLEYNEVSNYGANNEWTGNATNAGLGTPHNVLITNNASVNAPSAGARSLANNLTINSGSSFNTSNNQNFTIHKDLIANGNIQLLGDVYIKGDWTLGASANQTNNNKAVFFDAPSGNQVLTRTGNGDLFFDYLVINKNAGNVQLATGTNVVINSTTGEVLQINNSGSLDLNGRTLTINNNGGNIQVNGASTTRNITSGVAGAQLLVTGSKTVTGTANLNIASNVTTILTAGFDPGNNKTTFNGTLRIRPNGFINSNAPIYANTSTLEYNEVSNYNAINEWTGNATTAGLGTPHNVLITNNASVNSPSGERGVAGNVTIESGSTFTQNSTNGDLNVRGNWNCNGTLVSNNRWVQINGSALQSINGATNFGLLEIQNTAGVNLVGTVSANQSIRFTNGNFTLGSANRIGDSSLINFNGGTFRTSASGAGFSDVVGAMNLTENSTLQLGTGDHTITFANSTSQTWTSGRVLTINGWTGTPTASGAGSAGKIQVGVGGLTAGQLEQIQFTGFDLGAVITASGELVPRDFPTFYSKGSLAPNLTTSWSRTTDGTGASPLDFTAGNTRYIIQNGHHMTTSAAWSITGANSILRILDGGTLQSTFAITVPSTATFEIQDGGTYIHDNSSAFSSIFPTGSTISFGSNSNFIFQNTTTSITSNFNQVYGNFTINLTSISSALGLSGNLQTIQGNLTILNTNNQQVRLSNSGGSLTVGGDFILNGANVSFVLKNNTNPGDQTLNVNGNVSLLSGKFTLSNAASGGAARLICNGSEFSISENVTIEGTNEQAENTGFYFNRNGIQNVTISNVFGASSTINRFFYNAIQTTINETYNGTVAQETVNGTGATPLAGYSAWPINSIHVRNFTVNNPAGVTLRNQRTVNENLILTNGTLTAAANTTLIFQGDAITRTNGTLNFSSEGATLQMNNTISQTFPTGLFSGNITNLHLSGAGGVKANQNLTITGQLNLGSANNPSSINGDGLLDMVISYGDYATQASSNSTDPYNNLNSHTLTMVGSATTIGNADVTGKIRRTAIVSGTTYTFGNKNMQLTFNGENLPSYVEVVATRGDKGLHADKDGVDDLPGTDVSPIGGAAVKRLYQIKRQGGDTPTTFTLRLPYDQAELNGNTAENLVIWDHHLPYNGVTPHEHGKTAINTNERFVELANHGIRYLATDGATPQEGTFSTTKYWMLSNKLTQDILWLGAATDSWNVASNWSSGSVPSEDTKIVIPQVPTYQNELQVEGTVEVSSIDVKNNGSFKAKANAVVQVKGGVLSNGGAGSWNNQGNFVAESGSKIVFENPNATIAGNSKFHHLEVKNGAKLTIADGTTLEIEGNLTNFGELDANTTNNTIKFIGNNQSIPSTNGTNPGYKNILIDQVSEESEVVLAGSIEINGTLSIPKGKLVVNDKTLTLKGAFPSQAEKIITTNQSRLELRNSGSDNITLPNFGVIKDLVVDTDLALEATAPVTLHGDLQVVKGRLKLGIHAWNRNTLGGSLVLGNEAALEIGGTNSLPESFEIHDFDASSEVVYNGDAQVIKKPNDAAYGKLKLAGTGNKTIQDDLVEVQQDLVIEGGHLRVNSGNTLKVNNKFDNVSGLATFENNASLLQVNNIQNTGNITYKRTTGLLKHLDFVYWGAMVHQPQIRDMWMTNASETFYRFNPQGNNWVLINGNTQMQAGVGYIARARFNSNGWGAGPNPPSSLPWTANYVARPNNGNVSVDVVQNRFHLVANPYPSAIDAEAFIKQDESFDSSPLLPTIYIWTQASGINNNQYQSSDYATLNLFSNTPEGINLNGFTISKNIGAGQGFFVRTKNEAMPNPSVITFKNSYRLGGNNTNFTKPGPGKPEITQPVVMQKYWLQISNTLGNTKQTAVVHHPEGTPGYHVIHDSPAFNGNSTLNLFTLADNTRVSVNVTSPIQSTNEIPLGYNTTQAGNHTITFAHQENVPATQDIYLLDQLGFVYHNIKESPYVFTTTAGTFTDRFKIVFQNQTLSNPEINLPQWVVFAKDKHLHIHSGADLLESVTVYDLHGRLLLEKKELNHQVYQLPWNGSNEVLLLVLKSVDGKIYKTKVLVP
ncbi:MAG: beta strand repeat-containing protein [Flavobacterium sp.]